MISLQDLLEEIDFEPEVIFLHDGEKEIKIDYASLKEEFSFNLDSFLELVPIDGNVYFVDHAWKNEKDLHCNTHLLELLMRIDEKQNGVQDQKLSDYLLLVQQALDDLRYEDVDGITELTELLESNVEEL